MKGKRILAGVLSAAVLAGSGVAGGIAVLQVKGESSVKLTALKTNDEVQPFGLDTPAPRFSWRMESDEMGQKQTAYQILVAADDAFEDLMWDSKRQEDSRSVGIAYDGLPLQEASTYYWKVTVWDRDGLPITSEPVRFDMGLLGEEAWAGSQWISLGSAVPDEDPVDGFRYIAEGQLAVDNAVSAAVGLVFNYIDDQNFYMWQVTPGCYIRPHKWVNGVPAVLEEHVINFSSIAGTDALAREGITLSVEVTGESIVTFVNGQPVDTIPLAEAGGPVPYLGKIGVRSAGEESGRVSYLKLTNYTGSSEGTVVCDYQFRNGNPFFEGTVEDGALVTKGVDVLVTPDGTPVFRRAFTADREVVSARLFTAGLGVYDVYLNGERVGTRLADGRTVYDELKPGYTVPKKRTQSYAYDVTDQIRLGENALSANVTSGWWTGQVVGWVGQKEAFRAKLLLTYADGTQEWIGTDTATWKSSPASPVLSGDIYNGEIYDGNIDTSWKEPGYDDSGWRKPVENTEFQGVISNRVGSPVRVREDLERQAQSVTVYDGVTGEAEDRYGRIQVTGTYAAGEAFTLQPGEKAVVDLGQNFAGWSEVEVEGPQGAVITLHHGEMLNDNEGLHSRGNDGPEGSVYFANMRGAKCTDTYVLRGSGRETYHASFTYHGFRYVEITATAAVTIHRVSGLVVTSVWEDTGSLETGHTDLNRLIQNIVWGQYSNYVSIPTDCPQRDERQGWSADTQVFATAAAYNGDVKGFLMKWMADARDCQSEGPNNTGAFADYIPNINETGDSHGALGWTDAGIIVPYTVFQMYGDTAIIEENWEAMQTFMDVFMASSNKMGGHVIFGDWLAYESNSVPLQELCGVAYYAMDARMMAEMAEAIGRTADAEKYRQVYETEKAFFQEKYVTADGTMVFSQQTAQIMALMADLLPDDASRSKVTKALVDSLKRYGMRLQTGFLGTAAIMQTLSDCGEDDVAYQLLLQRKNPSWLYSVDQGATTIWERWNSYTKEDGFGDVNMNSFNHYSYGAVAEWMYSYMAGIQVDTENPGFHHVRLQPSPNRSIGSAWGTLDTAYGRITSVWSYEGDRFTYTAGIPANVTAEIAVPIEEGQTFLVNGKQPEDLRLDVDGIAYEGLANGEACFRMVAGTFELTAGVTPTSVIFLASGDADIEGDIRINGGDWEPITPTILVETGKPVTLEIRPVNDVDFSAAGWSGDLSGQGATLSFTPQGDLRLTAHFQSNGYDSLAIGAVVTEPGAGTDSNWGPEKLVDGILTSQNGSYGYTNQGLESQTPANPTRILFDLQKEERFNRFHLYPRTNLFAADGSTCAFPVDFEIQVSKDGHSWNTVGRYQEEAPYRKPLVIQLDKTLSARYIRLIVYGVSAPPGDGLIPYLQFAEFGVYYQSLTYDKDALQDLVEQADSLNREEYRPDTWTTLDQEIAAARAVLADPQADTARISDAYEALSQAMEALLPAQDPIHYRVEDFLREVLQHPESSPAALDSPWKPQIYTADGWTDMDTYTTGKIYRAPLNSDGSDTIELDPSVPQSGAKLFPSAYAVDEHSLTGNVALAFTAPQTGHYVFSGNLWATYGNGYNRARLVVNGRTVWPTESGNNGLAGWQDVRPGTNLSCELPLTLSKGDVVRLESTRGEWGNTLSVQGQISFVSPRSANALLRSLSGVTLDTAFDPEVARYTASVGYEVTKLDLLARADSRWATVQIVGADSLRVGKNYVLIVVKAENGNQKAYCIEVTRAADS